MIGLRTDLSRVDVKLLRGHVTRRTNNHALLRQANVILVDPKRKSARDVLRNPAGLNDTLLDMVAMTTTADAAPTTQTRAVSKETIDRVEAQIARLDALASGEITELNAVLVKAGVGHVTIL